jgi:hypothetical protein
MHETIEEMREAVFSRRSVQKLYLENRKKKLVLEDLHIDMAVLSKTHLKPHERFFISNYYFNLTNRFPGNKGIPHNHVDLCYICDTYT